MKWYEALPRNMLDKSPARWYSSSMRTRGYGPFKFEFYSFCSHHRVRRLDCNACNAGSWTNAWARKLDGRLHDRHYPLWFKWHNRKRSKIKRTLRKHFPNL